MGLVFIINTLALGYFYNVEKKDSIAEQIETVIPLAKEPVKSEVPQAPKDN